MGRIYVFEEPLVHVHDDLSPWASMNVKLDDRRQLVVEMTYENNDGYHPYYGFDKKLIVTPRGTGILIDRMDTTLTKLTKAFRDEFGGTSEESWSVSEVFELFNEIRNYLECLNVHYRIKTEYKYR